MDKIILSYHDSCLYQSDLMILQSDTAWLNDRVISFYFEYLQKDVFDNNKILLIGPEVTQAIKMMESIEEVNTIFLDPLNPTSRSHILFALNNNSSRVDAGGSHWSFGVYSKPENSFFHFDSSHNFNAKPFSTFVQILKKCFDCETAEKITIDCLQQDNSHDCGIFVLCHADLVFQQITKGETISSIKKLQPKKVGVKRSEVLQIVQSLAGS